VPREERILAACPNTSRRPCPASRPRAPITVLQDARQVPSPDGRVDPPRFPGHGGGESGRRPRQRSKMSILRCEQRRRPNRKRSCAHYSAVGAQGEGRTVVLLEDARAQGFAPAPRCLHARLHPDPEEAELRAAQDRACEAVDRHRGHRIHPRRGPQPPGALDRARPRRSCEGPARRALQDRARRPGHPVRQGPPAGPLPLRREEGEEVLPRKGPATKRQLVVDPVFGSPIVTQLINEFLLDGKKTVAEGIVYGALEGAREKNGQDPVVTLKTALDNIRLSLEVRSR